MVVNIESYFGDSCIKNLIEVIYDYREIQQKSPEVCTPGIFIRFGRPYSLSYLG